jgi:peptide/nickel transport system permease protein
MSADRYGPAGAGSPRNPSPRMPPAGAGRGQAPARRAALRWVGRAFLTLFGISLAAFLLLHLLPGDPALANLGTDIEARIPPEAYRAMRHRMGLDRPLGEQYFAWLGSLLQGDLGTSFADGRPVTRRIAERLPASLLLQLLALGAAVAVAVPLGAAGAHWRGGWFDGTSRWLLFLLFSLPGFWVALLLQVGLAVHLGWLPLQGLTGTGMEAAPLVDRALDRAAHLVLPVTCLALGQLAFLARFTRANVLESLGRDFVRTARAKGLPEGQVLRRHAFRHSLSPLLTLSGLTLPALVGGSILIETIFSWPGLGSLFFESVSRRDYPLVLALTLLSAALTLAGNLSADLLYRVADPRAGMVSR